MIAVFLAWWMSQLTALLPAWLRGAGVEAADALLVRGVAAGDEAVVRLSLRRHGEQQDLGEYRADDPALKTLPEIRDRLAILRLAPADVLTKRLSLPLAAQAELGQVLAFEMDRETPFAAEEVYWTHRVVATDRQRGQLSVEIWLVPKHRLASLLTQLVAVGIAPRWAEIDGDAVNGPLLPLDGEQPRLRNNARLLKPLAIACACLAVVACVAPFVYQSVRLAKLAEDLRASETTVAEAEPLRREIDRYTRDSGAIDDLANKAPRPLDALAALTRLIPDDTYLTEIDVRQRKVTFGGRSASAAKLIGLIAADGKFRNPTFAAPVTRLEAQRTEVFSIVTEVGSPPS